MKTETPINSEEVKKSFFHLLAAFTRDHQVNSQYIRCFIKWGIQLGININDLKNLETISIIPNDKPSKLTAIYHLVYMFYLDRVVEDIELEVATAYAEKIGFSKELVGDLFKSIATQKYDLHSVHNVKSEIEDFLKLHNL